MNLHCVEMGNSTGPIVAVVHGILGSGLNWRSFCQRLYRLRPELRFVLVDLRNHGRSPRINSPNTLMECAKDLLELQQRVGPFSAVVGHSFGGKVALQCSQIFPSSLQEVWGLDCNPSILLGQAKDENEVMLTMQMLRSVPIPVQRRSMVSDWLLQKGASLAIARWMTTNLQKEIDGYYWRFDLDGVEEMISDYFRRDLWDALEQPRRRCHLLRALDSDRWTADSIARLEALPQGYHTLQAGHWVHADNPEGLLHILSRHLRIETVS